jgi:2-desacetyl-2-hydroxyethyl bacteriochlorophyllide A dehydrogenase
MQNKRKAIFFTSPGTVRLEDMPPVEPGPGDVLVRTCVSGISAGTEMLIYRGQFPENLAIDENIESLAGAFQYPLQYGYTAVGKVIDTGSEVDRSWTGRLVFSFHPHESVFLARPGDLLPVPEDIQPEDAIFLPNMETAVNLVMDGRPILGEEVAVFGQGVVGLLTTALLGWYPLRRLVTLDRYSIRREWSLQLGAHASLDPTAPESGATLKTQFPGGADLVYELSGAPEALNGAIASAGFTGRVVVGSWYGKKNAPLDLGGHFHRSRLHLISSQVSTIAPEFSGRWSKSRRFEVAWEMIRRLHPSRLVTQRIPFRQAANAYRLLDEKPWETIQVVLDYEE